MNKHYDIVASYLNTPGLAWTRNIYSVDKLAAYVYNFAHSVEGWKITMDEAEAMAKVLIKWEEWRSKYEPPIAATRAAWQEIVCVSLKDIGE